MKLYKLLTTWLVGAFLLSTAWIPVAAAPPAAPTASGGTTRVIQPRGSSSFTATATGSVAGVQSNELSAGVGPDSAGSRALAANKKFAGVNRALSRSSGANDRSVNAGQEDQTNPALNISFDGLNHRNQRLANGGNQFSLEPPDQGLCVGSGVELETINDVLRVYHPDGTPVTGIEDLNTFYGYPAAINRTTGARGPFVTDPSCLFDQATGRFYHVVLTLDVDPASGAFLGSNHLDLAVSMSSDPTGGWFLYTIPVQDDGTQGTPDHGCPLNNDGTGHGPCLGDYPHIGADANGIYLTTNEYAFAPNFIYMGAQVYAISKAQLAAGTATTVVQFNTAHDAPGGHPGFTVWPSQGSGAGGHNTVSVANRGTEYFLSSTAGDEAQCTSGVNCTPGTRTSKNILLWTLKGTGSLNTASPALSLSNQSVKVDKYAVPPASNQKAGNFPLGQCFNDTACSTFLTGGPDPYAPEVEYALDSNDSRMQQVSFVNGLLWGALDTDVKVDGQHKAGIEYFAVRPSGDLELQGTLALRNNNLTYPAVGMLSNGRGVIAFTVVGDTHYPSAGYAGLSADNGAGSVHIAQEGAGPADGFSGYLVEGNPPGTNRPRWGDYGATAVDGSHIWIASEYIGQTCTLAQYESTPFGSCGGTRTTLANWDTRISQVTP